jgi:molecular chaperone GrpE
MRISLNPFFSASRRAFDTLKGVETQNPDTNQEELAEVPQEIAADTPTDSSLAALTTERDQLLADKAELHDMVLRGRAEFDNFRRRVERERVESWQAATAAAVKELLPVLDDFERALQVKTADENYSKGVELIFNRFFESLKKLGLETMETVGQPFDPNVHEAIGRVEMPVAVDGTVIAEMQKGYNFKGKLLRPAWVQVAVNPQEQK